MNYYDVVVAIAQMNQNLRLPWWKLEKDVSFYEKKLGVSVDRCKLKESWRDFVKVSYSQHHVGLTFRY